ncbi:MAG: tyrosine protein phosphatase [Archangiaceae bacterium]|nr:tyrosine protein phosphatase [Archangiaceae bacterium]
MRVHWVEGLSVGRLGICARPRGNDWLDDELKQAKADGVDVVVSLLEDDEAKEIGVQDEAGAASRAGVEFWRFPIADRDVPADEGAAVAFARKAWARVSANGSVVIHCRMGIGRSSVMAALALVVGGVPVVRAWQQLSMAREMVVPDTFEQKAWVDRVAKRLADGELQ